MTIEKKREHYLGCDILATKDKNESGFVSYDWFLYKDEKFLMTDRNTIDGSGPLQSVQHAINDCKKNIDSLIRTNSLK